MGLVQGGRDQPREAQAAFRSRQVGAEVPGGTGLGARAPCLMGPAACPLCQGPTRHTPLLDDTLASLSEPAGSSEPGCSGWHTASLPSHS